MNTKEAKDFLVGQTAQQAAIQESTLSDLEKRMMYFTESDESCGNPIQLNEEFEAQYDTAEYEAKIAGLMKNAYKRLNKENPETKRLWDDAIKTLFKGDHYILVLWNQVPAERPPHDSLKLLLSGVLLVAILGVAIFFAENFGIKSTLAQKVILYPLIVLLAVAFVKLLGSARTL